MIHFVLVVLISLGWSSCKKDNRPIQNTQAETDTVSDIGTIRYLALGDSYTIGESVAVNQRWPVQLASALEGNSDGMVEVEIIARTGWTTGQLGSAILSQQPQGLYDMVSLLIGVNNQFQRLDSTEYRHEFRDLLQQSVAFAGGNPDHVIVVSIPDYGVTPFASKMDTARIAAEIDGYNLINFQETQLQGARYVDVTPVSRLAKLDLSLLAPDSLHPGGKMYKQWVNLILPEARAIIEDRFQEDDR